MQRLVVNCPNCGESFDLSEQQTAAILMQVRDQAFESELVSREEGIRKSLQAQAALDLEKLKSRHESELLQFKSQSESAVSELKQQLSAAKLDASSREQKAYLSCSEELSALKSEVASKDAALAQVATERKLAESALRESYEKQLALKDEQVAYYKDFKAKQSTKMIGESLERYCMDEFNKIRMAAYPMAYFEKDNDARTGSKGDFIFREQKDGVELVSIMFEMKNEADMTATKHKNEDFFRELDKDRREKGCEYAVLVSMLESDSEYYNTGIVDVSYKYGKMYVVRPQFFLSIIALIRNAALSALSYKQELLRVQERDLDIQRFEEHLLDVKSGMNKNYRIASRKVLGSIEEIDKVITKLQKIREELVSSERNIRLMNDKAEALSVKKLAKDSPGIRERL